MYKGTFKNSWKVILYEEPICRFHNFCTKILLFYLKFLFHFSLCERQTDRFPIDNVYNNWGWAMLKPEPQNSI